MSENYTSANIKVLKGLEAVRKRPGMYIGNTGYEGLHHLVWEVVDNSIDEAAAGYGKKIIVERYADHSISVEDFGRGIPVDIHKTEGISTLEVVLTVLHAGGKFDQETYKTSGGLHGVGASVTNALSETLSVEVCRDGQKHRMAFEKGITVVPLSVVGKCSQSGTKIKFKADPLIFKNPYSLEGVEKQGTEYNDKKIMDRLEELAFLNKGLEMVFIADGQEHSFKYENGLKDFVKKEISGSIFEPIVFTGNEFGVEVEVGFSYGKSYDTNVKSFVNNIPTKEGGSHEIGSLLAINSSLIQHMKNKGVKKTEAITQEDTKEGIVCIVSVRVVDPEFEGQTKGKLNNSDARKATFKVVKDKFSVWLEENPKSYNEILKKILLAQKAREASKKSRETVRKTDMDKGTGVLPSKLADCSSTNAVECELILCEGASASGCFSGETLVELAIGAPDSIENIAKRFESGEELFVYTYNHETDKIELQKIENCWKTKTTNDLVKVYLDNGKEIICTSDHKFLLRDGSYVEAKNLPENVSLMPIYKNISKKGENSHALDGYEFITQNNGDIEYTHFLADQYNKKNKLYEDEIKRGRYVRHHIDFNKRNNNPNNIIRMDWGDHRKLHNDQCRITLHTPEAKAKVRATMATPESKEKRSAISVDLWKDKEFRKKYPKNNHKNMRQIQIDNGQMNTEHLIEYWLKPENIEKRSINGLNFFKNNPEQKEVLSKLAKKQWKDKDLLAWRSKKTKEQMSDPEMRLRTTKSMILTRIKSSLNILNIYGIEQYPYKIKEKEFNKITINLKRLLFKMKDYEQFNGINTINDLVLSDYYTYNHKVLKVELYNVMLDVYDIEVPGTHNFALEAGIFVHNSAKQGRDRKTQAILPLKGKVINVMKADLDKVLKNEEISNIITALGTGYGKNLDISKIRYHKIIIMTDADVDGEHIAFLLILLFYKFFRGVIDAGYLYISVPPLYRASKGDKVGYFDDMDSLEKFARSLSKEKKSSREELLKSWTITRFKGLGEMNPEQLEETAMNKETRKLVQIKIDKGEEALTEKILTLLGGDDSEFRKKFLMSYTDRADVDIS